LRVFILEPTKIVVFDGIEKLAESKLNELSKVLQLFEELTSYFR